MLIRRAEIDATGTWDVRVEGECVVALQRDLPPAPDEVVIEAFGGALLPGLHDHHLHLYAMAAAEDSARCGPPAVENRAALARALSHAAPRNGWIRAVGYHDSVAGPLGRAELDAMRSDLPVRLQHRSGALWILNSAGVNRLGLDRGVDAPGVERDADRRATGRLFRLDDWLRTQLGSSARPDLTAVGQRLARYGVTGATDATPGNDAGTLAALAAAVSDWELPQRLLVMGGLDLPDLQHPALERGAVKILLSETRLPAFHSLCATLEAAHRGGRAVAVHCVTRTELVVALRALAEVGVVEGDRIEHAAVAPPDVMVLLAGLGVSVVTQPNFIFERGDAYAVEVEASEQPWLYRCAGFVEASLPLAAGTDAPFGDPDPWLAVRAAVTRRTASGRSLGSDEALSPERALALFTSPAHAPGGPPRRVVAGAPADLCLLDAPWDTMRRELSSERVTATWCRGRLVWQRGDLAVRSAVRPYRVSASTRRRSPEATGP